MFRWGAAARAACGLALLGALHAAPARADDAFWRRLSEKYPGEKSAIILDNECVDYVTYTGEVRFTDVTQQQGLSETKTGGQFTGSSFTVDSRYRWLCAVYDPRRCPELSTFRIPFHSHRTINGLSARLIRRDGTPVPVRKEMIEDRPRVSDAPAYADLRERVVNFGDLPDSCVLEVTYSLRGSENFAVNRFVFDQPYPTDRASYTITTPASVVGGFPWWADSFRGYGIDLPRTETVTGSTGELQRYIWELSNIPAMPDEEMSSTRLARGRSVDLCAAFERNWDNLLAWYRDDTERVYAEDSRGADIARELVRGIDPDSLEERARVIFEHVRGTVRTVPIPVNTTTLTPESPSEVLERGYGDPKDVAACLAYLLRSAGVDARVALLSTAATGRFDAYFPAFHGFDHALVHVLLPFREAWLDATDPIVGFGELPIAVRGGNWEYAATPLLVWDGGPNLWDPSGDHVTVTPYAAGDCGYALGDTKVAWDESGVLRVSARAVYTGAHSLILRGALRGKSAEEQSSMFAAWLRLAEGEAKLESIHAPNLDSLGTNLAVEYTLSRPWTPGAEEVRVPTRFFDLPSPSQIPTTAKRLSALVLEYPELITSDFSVPAPPGYQVEAFPADLEITSEFLGFRRVYRERTDAVTIDSSLGMKEGNLAQSLFGNYVRALDEIRKAGEAELVFKKTSLLGQAGG